MDHYHYAIAGYIAKCAVAMNGVDVITFTAGVGENGPIERAMVAKRLRPLGVIIDEEKNNHIESYKEKQQGEERYNLHVRRRGVKKPILEAENSSDGQCQEKKKYNKKMERYHRHYIRGKNERKCI